MICGPDSEAYIASFEKYEQAGFDHVSLHQIGSDRAGYLEFYQREVFPRLRNAERR